MANRLRQIVAVSSALLLTVNCASASAADLQGPVDGLRRLDERVLTVGHRLAVAGRELCASHQFHAGFLIHDLSQYAGSARRQLAAAGLAAGPGVLALVPGGPAAQAGLRRDDVLLAADGQALPRAPEGVENSYAPTERIIGALERAFLDGRAQLTVRRGGTDQQVDVSAAIGCASRFQVTPSRRLNALADGRYEQVTSGLAGFA